MIEEEKKISSTDTSEEFTSDDDSHKRRRRKKVVQNLKCPLCESGVKHVSYKDIFQLKKFTSVRGKIISSEKSGLCHKHQKQLKRAIKRARYMALLPYVADE
ncbi:MAG: 30S ribosomal protein S18 [Candidatus Dojkabacteria bacterium]|nr:30S ribosomal protein S18 [Candidatus Dojkabacteria bacterium]